MKLLLLIPLILAIGVIPAFALSGTLIGENCDNWSGIKHAACNDIQSLNERINYLEELTIPNFDKPSTAYEVKIYDSSERGIIIVEWLTQSFHNDSFVGIKLINESNTFIAGMNMRADMGINQQIYGIDYETANQVSKLQFTSEYDQIVLEVDFILE